MHPSRRLKSFLLVWCSRVGYFNLPMICRKVLRISHNLNGTVIIGKHLFAPLRALTFFLSFPPLCNSWKLNTVRELFSSTSRVICPWFWVLHMEGTWNRMTSRTGHPDAMWMENASGHMTVEQLAPGNHLNIDPKGQYQWEYFMVILNVEKVERS